MASGKTITLLKALVWALSLAPAALLAWGAYSGALGANPIEKITHDTGWWALLFLTLSLAVTPLRRLTKWNQLVRFRRLIGLFAFFYSALHLATYVVLDQYFDFSAILEDIVERPYITVGFVAFVCLLLLAATSTRGSIRRLGKRWTVLHRLVYVAAPLAVLHFFWKRSAKNDTVEPLTFAAVLLVLLAFRVYTWYASRRSPARAGVTDAVPQ